jgi:hypothetical protein
MSLVAIVLVHGLIVAAPLTRVIRVRSVISPHPCQCSFSGSLRSTRPEAATHHGWQRVVTGRYKVSWLDQSSIAEILVWRRIPNPGSSSSSRSLYTAREPATGSPSNSLLMLTIPGKLCRVFPEDLTLCRAKSRKKFFGFNSLQT